MIFKDKSCCFFIIENRNQRDQKQRKEEIALERRRRTAKSQYLNRVITYMREHLQENLTLTQIAREAGLSESYLNAVFKECIKCAPMDYYINMKMEQACYLLCNTDLHIYQVAQHLGYENQYYFFRRAFEEGTGSVSQEGIRKCPGYRQFPCRFPAEDRWELGPQFACNSSVRKK